MSDSNQKYECMGDLNDLSLEDITRDFIVSSESTSGVICDTICTVEITEVSTPKIDFDTPLRKVISSTSHLVDKEMNIADNDTTDNEHKDVWESTSDCDDKNDCSPICKLDRCRNDCKSDKCVVTLIPEVPTSAIENINSADDIKSEETTQIVSLIDKFVLRLEAFINITYSTSNMTIVDGIIKYLHVVQSLVYPFDKITNIEAYAILIAAVCKSAYKTNTDIVKICIARSNFYKDIEINDQEVLVEIVNSGLIEYYSTKSDELDTNPSYVCTYLRDADEYIGLLITFNKHNLVGVSKNVEEEIGKMKLRTAGVTRKIIKIVEGIETIASVVSDMCK